MYTICSVVQYTAVNKLSHLLWALRCLFEPNHLLLLPLSPAQTTPLTSIVLSIIYSIYGFQILAWFPCANLTYAREEWMRFAPILDNSMGRVSERGRSQAPDTISLLWPCALALKRKNTPGIHHRSSSPTPSPRQNTNMPTQKYISHNFFSFTCPPQVLSSCHSDGPYCTGETKEETTITLGYWSALSGLKRLWWAKAVWDSGGVRGGRWWVQRS